MVILHRVGFPILVACTNTTKISSIIIFMYMWSLDIINIITGASNNFYDDTNNIIEVYVVRCSVIRHINHQH